MFRGQIFRSSDTKVFSMGSLKALDMGSSLQLVVFRSESATNGYCEGMYDVSESDNHEYFSCYEKEVRKTPQQQ